MKIKINWFNTILVILFTIAALIFPFVNPCQSEDGRVCTWNAQEVGNGTGRSFTNFYGINLYHP